MIYFCADDYGLNKIASMRIQKCIDEGALNKVSIFPNFSSLNSLDFEKISQNKKVDISLHLNLVEGKCTLDARDINLIADKNGNFKYSFVGLFFKSLFNKRKFEAQVYKEIKSQILLWKKILPKNCGFLIDSHQHTHMIPSIFKTIIKVLKEEKINLKYLRIPAEPIYPFIKTPSLYFTYKPVNLIKQWLLKFLWRVNKRYTKGYKIPTACFFGILFSGKMDEKRVGKVLPHYIKLAEKKGKDIEVLFHPGYLYKDEVTLADDLCFKKFYLSKDRKTEFDTVIKL